MSEGSENSRSFKDSGRSNEKDTEDGASFKEGGSETPQVRRSSRESRAPVRYSPSANYMLMIENGELESYSEALRKKALQSKWVFRVKEEQDGKKRYKARLVVKGFQQKRRVDYNEIFSLVVKMTTIGLVLSIIASKDLHLEQLDVKTTFLHGDLDEDIYMTQPERLDVNLWENSSSSERNKHPRRRLLDEEWLRFLMLQQLAGALRSCQMVATLLERYFEGYLCFSRKRVVLEGFSVVRYEYYGKILGAKNPADMLTKVVTTEKLKLCATKVRAVALLKGRSFEVYKDYLRWRVSAYAEAPWDPTLKYSRTRLTKAQRIGFEKSALKARL
ncbi:putative RNA-directed DNA polymerase [Tanacetum coccineum]|uniref:RNA-directed DNA polymerase n=1 Tax=Tanacetum coccineum TaxID=301880 RepID=A0ABQ5I2N2_9ASTR